MLMGQETELNLDNPIFTLYINIEGLPRQRAEELLSGYIGMFNQYNNITVWVLASNITKMECLYDGKLKTRDKEMINVITEINNRIDMLSNCGNFEDFKLNLREWRINRLASEL